MKLSKFDTDIGKIYCSYNKDTDEFDKIRVIDIDRDNDIVKLGRLDKFNHMDKCNVDLVTTELFDTIRQKCVLLKSDGIASITNVVSATRATQEIKDVVIVYFPTDKVTKSAEPYRPRIVARQGIDNIFAAGTVGMAVSINTLPNGYALSDFMFNERVLSSRLIHVYKTDTEDELATLFDNKESNEIMNSLFTHAVNFHVNTDQNYIPIEKEDDCIDGYCNSIKRFLVESDFMTELYDDLGVMKIDFELETNVPIDDPDDKLLISTLCGGGIRINKAVPIRFDYDINMDFVKMRYVIISDINNNLFIVPYTISENEIDADSVYKMTDDVTNKLQERLKKIVKAYDSSSK